MDRFKFRVWRIKENCYNHQEPFPTCCMQENGLLAYFNEERQMQNYIVEQCTGLKDKNGNLIYEGDILEVKWKNDDYPRYYEVNFEEGAFGIKPLECNDWLDSEYISDISQATLIIGNIHENKDLLEDK